jgi:hypothetical protein
MTSPTYFNSAGRLIEYAMRDAGLLAKGQRPKSSDYAEYMNRLNDLINTWQVQGIKLFLLQDISVTPVAGTQTYTMSPTGNVVMTKPLRVVDAYYLDSGDAQRPLIPLSLTEWNRLSNLQSSGSTNQYYVNAQATSLIIKVYPIPDATTATGTLHFIVQNQVPNFVSITDTSAFPVEWAMALRWGLADEICTGQPQAIMSRCAQKANTYKSILEDWDQEETPIRFTMNMMHHPRSFE